MTKSLSCVIKQLGIAKFIQASIRRNDKKDDQLRKLTEVTVHKTCQRTYTRESNIQLAIKKTEQCRDNRQRRQDGRVFYFSSNCFFLLE